MKRVILTIAVVLFGWITIGAQGLATKSKMSPWLQKQYRQHHEAVQKNGGPLRVKGRPVRNYILTLVQSTDDGQTIREKGGVVWQDFGGGICAAFLPMDSLSVLNQTPGIMRMEANESSEIQNDTTAVIIGVDKAWDFENTLNSSLPPSGGAVGGLPIPQAFTGKGVFAGIVDSAIDFTHPAFRHEDGTSRIKWYWDLLAENDNPDEFGQIYSSSDAVLAAQHSTHAEENDHGTHVLGSMAGDGLNGRYVGMAPEVDIVGCNHPFEEATDTFLNSLGEYVKRHVGVDMDFTDDIFQVGVSNAVELIELSRIFAQADAAGQPCVVNWSFGASANFFNDNTLYEEVFNHMVGPGHIVVKSAGNDGDYNIYLKKESGIPLDQDIYCSTTRDYFSLTIRTEPDEPFFDFALQLDGIEQTFIVNTESICEAYLKDSYLYVDNGDVYLQFQMEYGAFGMPVYEIFIAPEGDFAKSLTSDEVIMLHGKIQIGSDPRVELRGGKYSSDMVLFSIDNCFNSRGCHQGTISSPGNMARIITAGGMHHRSNITNVAGKPATYTALGSKEGQLMSFSSCGPTMEGRIKPDVVAPGHNIVSVLNSFYMVEDEEDVEYLTVYRDKELGKNYGMWAMSGTSMAAPIVSGVIALWLQAKPDLTPEDVMGVIERTSHQPEPEFSGTGKNVFYGWGEIDAYAGLLDILDIVTAIPELSTHQPAGVKFRLQGHTLYIDGAEDGTPIRIYTTDGRLIISASLSGSSVSLPADSPAGVYAVQVGKLGSTLIRL